MDMHGIIFAYNSAIGMRELTEKRTAAAVTFAAQYKAIDFMLSNMVNSGISDVGVVMRENYQPLIDHLGTGVPWDLSRKNGGLRILPPFGMSRASSREGYRGKMDSLIDIFSYIKEIRQKYILLADGDIIANIDFDDVLRHHIETGSDMTIVCVPASNALSSDAHFSFDLSGFAVDVVTKSEQRSDYESTGVATLGVYLLEKSLFISFIEKYASKSMFTFERDLLKELYAAMKVSGYMFSGFASRIHSVRSYFNDNMLLLEEAARQSLFNPASPIKTKSVDAASTYYSPGAVVHRCLVADGCHIDGDVSNCILAQGVRIEKGAKVSNCIIMQDVVIGKDVRLEYVISDNDVRINDRRELIGQESYPVIIAKGSVI